MKNSAFLAYQSVQEKNGSTVVEFYANNNDQPDWQGENENEQASQDIQGSFNQAVDWSSIGRLTAIHYKNAGKIIQN